MNSSRPPHSLPLDPQTRIAQSYYGVLGLHPSASVLEIRRAYRTLSKEYHPDTTRLPAAMATEKFQQLNEAYGILSNPDRRSLYDLQLGYSRQYVSQTQDFVRSPQKLDPGPFSNSAYLDPYDRPLSSGEIFALFMLGITFLACLLLVIGLGLARGEFSTTAIALLGNGFHHIP